MLLTAPHTARTISKRKDRRKIKKNNSEKTGEKQGTDTRQTSSIICILGIHNDLPESDFVFAAAACDEL